MSVYKFYSATLNGNNLASIDFAKDGIITALSVSIRPQTLDLLDDSLDIELSFVSISTFTIHDSRSSLISHHVSQQFLTTGGGVGSLSHGISGLKIPISAGERVHMHGQISGGGLGVGYGYIYVDDGINQRPAPRRR